MSTIPPLESHLAVAVRVHLDSPEEHARGVCSALEQLLDALLHERGLLDEGQQIDGLLAQRAISVSPTEIELQGTALWLDAESAHWMEPMAARVRLRPSAEGSGLAEYELSFGRKPGLRSQPYSDQWQRPDLDAPVDWLCTIRGPAQPS